MTVSELVSKLESALEDAKAEKQTTYGEYVDAPGGVSKYPAKLKWSNACRSVRELELTLKTVGKFRGTPESAGGRTE